MIKNLLQLALLGLAAAAFSSCNATAGLGEDLQDAGQNLERAAQRND